VARSHVRKIALMVSILVAALVVWSSLALQAPPTRLMTRSSPVVLRREMSALKEAEPSKKKPKGFLRRLWRTQTLEQPEEAPSSPSEKEEERPSPDASSSSSQEDDDTTVVPVVAEVSQFDEFLIEWGLKEDPRVPEDCRVSPLDKIKSSGRAGVAAYALTEGAFWLSSVPLAIATIAYTTGSLPDVSTLEGKEQIAGYVFAFTTFARGLVPVRIALALALAPWCDRNVIQRFWPPTDLPEDCAVLPDADDETKPL